MKLVHPLLEQQIMFSENNINVLVIENRKFMSEFVQEFNNQINGLEGRFVLSDSGKEAKIDKKVEIIIDYFNIDFNNKKIINKLYKFMLETAMNEEFYVKTTEVKNTILKYLYDIEEKIEFEVTNDEEFDITLIFKAINVKFEVNELSFAEKLVEYLKLLSNLGTIKIFILINLKSFVSDEELKEIYKYTIYNKLNLLLIENMESNAHFQEEVVHIVDEDLCEI